MPRVSECGEVRGALLPPVFSDISPRSPQKVSAHRTPRCVGALHTSASVLFPGFGSLLHSWAQPQLFPDLLHRFLPGDIVGFRPRSSSEEQTGPLCGSFPHGCWRLASSWTLSNLGVTLTQHSPRRVSVYTEGLAPRGP